MARINTKAMKKLNKERNSVHTTVQATYSVFKEDDKKYFQIDTYGRNTRKLGNKISQSIQLDREDAIMLIELLSEEFDLIFKLS